MLYRPSTLIRRPGAMTAGNTPMDFPSIFQEVDLRVSGGPFLVGGFAGSENPVSGATFEGTSNWDGLLPYVSDNWFSIVDNWFGYHCDEIELILVDEVFWQLTAYGLDLGSGVYWWVGYHVGYSPIGWYDRLYSTFSPERVLVTKA